MSQQSRSDWEQQYDDRYGMKLTRDGDSIKLSRPHPAADDGTYEVVAHLGDRTYHTTHARVNEALDRVAMVVLMDKREPEFEVGDDVFVVSDGFEAVVQRGEVVRNNDEYQSIDVHFYYDPFDPESSEERVIGCDPSELLHAHAGTVELHQFIGRDNLLEWEDFAGQSADGVEVTYDD